MIGYLKGKVLYANNGTVLLDCNGIGYEVTCSSQAFCQITASGEGAIYTYMNVTENGVSLYGFESLEEKSMFLKLITVSGVGPKMGIGVLSSMPLKELAYIIASQDVKSLSKVKGLGKKTAERIILELRENISTLDLPTDKKEQKALAQTITPIENDAIIALMSLGFNRATSEVAVKTAVSNGADTIESIITIALQVIK
ncbi:MAG: Holliday junction branch migration protein RuvA [Clostridia bacterium]|nr:Holliday junction branch migration protein RuvA [Clostridia bacterium]